MSISSIHNHSIASLDQNVNTTPADLKEKALNAIFNKDAESLRAVLKEGFNPNTLFTLDSKIIDQIFSLDTSEESSWESFTAFIVYALFENKEMPLLFIAAYNEDIDSVEVLLEHGADVHFKMALDEDEPEHSPLCIDSGDQGVLIEIIDLLHQHGLTIEEMIDPEYLNPLELLECAKEENNLQLISFLENHGYHLN